MIPPSVRPSNLGNHLPGEVKLEARVAPCTRPPAHAFRLANFDFDAVQ